MLSCSPPSSIVTRWDSLAACYSLHNSYQTGVTGRSTSAMWPWQEARMLLWSEKAAMILWSTDILFCPDNIVLICPAPRYPPVHLLIIIIFTLITIIIIIINVTVEIWTLTVLVCYRRVELEILNTPSSSLPSSNHATHRTRWSDSVTPGQH